MHDIVPSPQNHIFSGAADYRTFDLHGSHYEIGHELGAACTPFVFPPKWPDLASPDFAQACLAHLVEVHHPLVDELQGYIDAQGVDREYALSHIFRPRLTGPLVPPHSPAEPGGCSSAAWRTPDGHILVGRNYDFHPFQRMRLRIRLVPDSGFPTLGACGSLPGSRYDGVNKHGLLVSLHVVLCNQPDEIKPGIPAHYIPRILLETCRNVEEALACLWAIPHIYSFNYLLADPQSFIVVEAHQTRIRTLEPAGDHQVVTNHYRHADMVSLLGRRRSDNSCRRLERLHQFLADCSDGDPWVTTQTLMRDHQAPVCGHKGHYTTLWSMVADLTAQRIAYAPGIPCRTPYQNLPWPTDQ